MTKLRKGEIMLRQSLLAAALATILIVGGCATTPPYNPFKVTQEEFYGKIKTIALAPVGVPRDLENPDPVTGKRDETKFKTVREHALRELSTKFKADAVLYPNIRAGTARFAGGQANWDGASESLSPTEGFMGMLMVGQFQGTTGALSLIVTIENIHGVDAYVNGGGIQLISKLSGGKFVPVPRSQLFADEKRIAAAVNIALGPLARNPAPAEAPKVQP